MMEAFLQTNVALSAQNAEYGGEKRKKLTVLALSSMILLIDKDGKDRQRKQEVFSQKKREQSDAKDPSRARQFQHTPVA